MPFTMTLKDAGVTLLVNDSVPITKIGAAMKRGGVLAVQTVGGKLCLVRGSDVVLVREITDSEIEANNKAVAEQREKEARFHPAPQRIIPGNRH
jgi:hypothetical protein